MQSAMHESPKILTWFRLNPLVRCIKHYGHVSPTASTGLFDGYDLILDCTDRPTTRYMISDAAVVTGKPLISASALRTEGQLMVLNNPPGKNGTSPSGPCYRCIFRTPPPPESVTSCGEGGILGPVVGVMGVLMALEAIKTIVSADRTTSAVVDHDEKPSMTLFSAYARPSFRSIRLRGKRVDCYACGKNAPLSRKAMLSGEVDYNAFCGVLPSVSLLEKSERITARELWYLEREWPKDYVLLDVRDETQFGICHLPGSINVPLSTLERINVFDEEAVPPELQVLGPKNSNVSIHTICRFGNDSQVAVRRLQSLGYGQEGRRRIGDVIGGLRAWKLDVDNQWPEY